MQDFMYSIISIVAFAVHLVINPNLFKKEANNTKTEKIYKLLMLTILIYYITDAGWGFFAGLNNIPALFLNTTIYFIAMASALVCWSFYVYEYLSIKTITGKIYKYIGFGYFVIEVIALILNFFLPCFFWFDEYDAYHTGIIRNIALWTQVALFLLTVIIVGVKTLSVSGIIKSRHLAIFSFSLVMMLANLFQILYPLLPIYAMGCLVGCSILHVYIVEDEREEYRNIIAEEKNVAERANKAKTTFLFNMSHDIRTPMNAIIGFTTMAKKNAKDEKVVDYLNKIDVAGNQLLKLINQVLEMARIESGKVELIEKPVDLIEKNQIFSTIYCELAKSKDVSFEVLPSKITDRYVYIDEDKMDQITNNIISNAIKYTPSGGRVTYFTEEKEYEKEGYGLYVITVKDTGIGMSKEFLDTIFDEFSRENTSTVSNIQGTGLGMSIVKKISDLMGGSIEIASEKGRGTTISVSIPMKINNNYFVEKETEEKIINVSGYKILLVEDNEMNREIASEILSEKGVVVSCAEDGDIAVEKIKNSNPGDYDLVLMDIQMPRMNGYDATKAIRALDNKELANIPIIAMTANAFEEDKQNALNVGMNDHIAKPIDAKKLYSIIYRILKE